MGLGAGKTVNQTSLGPPGFQMPYISEALQGAQRLYQGRGPQFFPGQTVAQFTPAQVEAQNALLQAARQMGGVGQSILAATQGILDQDPTRNPYVDQVANAVARRTTQELTEQWLPAVRGGAVSSGTLGGSRQALAEGIMGQRAAQELSSTLSQLYADQYNQGFNRQLAAMQMMPTAIQASFAPWLTAAGVGEQQQSLEQANINEAIARWTHEQELPYRQLVNYFNVVGQPLGSSGMSTVSAEGGAGQTAGGILSFLGLLWQILNGG